MCQKGTVDVMMIVESIYINGHGEHTNGDSWHR